MTDYHQMPSGSTPAIQGKDPFYVVKDRMQAVLSQLSLDYDQWKEALNKTNTHRNAKFKPLTQSVKVGLKALVPDLRDLEDTISIVTSNREKFKDITDTELANRRKFVSETKEFMQDVQQSFNSQKTRAKIERDQSEALTTSERVTAREAENRRDAQDFIENKRAQQQQLQDKQDLVLDDMHAALERLGAMGEDIKREQEQSKRDLDDLERGVDNASSTPIFASKQMPNVVAGVDASLDKSDFDPATDRVLNINAFQTTGRFEIGNAPSVLPRSRSFNLYNEDFGILKRTPITEQVTVEFRFEVFNTFNRVRFAAPETSNVSSPSGFGQVGGQANAPRSGQFSLKVLF